MSTAQLWAFIRYFPPSFSDRIPKDSEHWGLILLFSEIIDIVMAPKLMESTLLYFNYLYVNFLESFKRLYPEASIRPKMHFLIHLPNIVSINGPMRTFWTLNYERLNGKIEAPSHIMQNYRNPQFTIAYRRQCAVVKPNYCHKDSVVIQSAIEISASSFPNAETSLGVLPTDLICVTDCVVIRGIEFKKNFFLVVEKINFFLVVEKIHRGFSFGKIEGIICENKDDRFSLLTSTLQKNSIIIHIVMR